MTQTTIAAAHLDLLTERCQDAWHDHEVLSKEASDLQEALRASVPDELYVQILEVTSAIEAAEWSYLQAIGTELARHMPALAPTVNAVWSHVLEIKNLDPSRCCITAEPGQE
jgi:hypothetical protein